MKCPQTIFHAHTMRGPKLLAQKRQNLSLGLISLAAYLFLFIDILLKLQQQLLMCFCKV